MQPILLTHCGAGSDRSVQDAAETAGRVGLAILHRGGRALDAVVEAVAILEDDPRLNAGTGSRLRTDGRIQMDAAVMGWNLEAGAVAAIERVKNPIRVARDVLLTPHILLVGPDAVAFARARGHADYDPTTPASRAKLEESLRMIQEGRVPRYYRKFNGLDLHETVGAVARDRRGHCAAAVSTGGTSFMLPGRVGDSPILGSGLYAGPYGAVCATGIGEEIMKRVLSKYVYDQMAAGRSPQTAADRGVALFPRGISVGLIAVGKRGWGEACDRDMAYYASAKGRTL
ncbi:MAG TPA: isoaspartyl peptidase/L-asparaginase [Thermoplasmata archaeon]|nr:isoaspartyl peptidase/L-asparaginase [Thermoplasmata archaeon]